VQVQVVVDGVVAPRLKQGWSGGMGLRRDGLGRRRVCPVSAEGRRDGELVISHPDLAPAADGAREKDMLLLLRPGDLGSLPATV